MAGTRIVHRVLPSMVSLVLVLSSCSKLMPSAATRRPFLVGPDGGIHAGFVPPSGREIAFEVQNPTAKPFWIIKVRKSCSCTHVTIPDVVPPHQSVRGIMRILGNRLPASRRATFVLEARDPKQSLVIPVSFWSGAVPCVQPPQARFEWAGQGLTTTTSLWVEAHKNDRFAVEDSDFDVQVLPGNGRISAGSGKSVTFRNDGLCCISLKLKLRSGASKGVGGITYSCGNDLHTIRIPYTIAEEDGVTVKPARVDIYFHSGQQQPLERVFIATARFPFVPEVVHSPEFCNARFERITERSWKLVATVDPNTLPHGLANFEIRVLSRASGKGRDYKDSCVINVTEGM